jgi:hypothetical protein
LGTDFINIVIFKALWKSNIIVVCNTYTILLLFNRCLIINDISLCLSHPIYFPILQSNYRGDKEIRFEKPKQQKPSRRIQTRPSNQNNKKLSRPISSGGGLRPGYWGWVVVCCNKKKNTEKKNVRVRQRETRQHKFFSWEIRERPESRERVFFCFYSKLRERELRS